MADIKIKDLYTMDETIAKDFVSKFEYPTPVHDKPKELGKLCLY